MIALEALAGDGEAMGLLLRLLPKGVCLLLVSVVALEVRFSGVVIANEAMSFRSPEPLWQYFGTNVVPR